MSLLDTLKKNRDSYSPLNRLLTEFEDYLKEDLEKIKNEMIKKSLKGESSHTIKFIVNDNFSKKIKDESLRKIRKKFKKIIKNIFDIDAVVTSNFVTSCVGQKCVLFKGKIEW